MSKNKTVDTASPFFEKTAWASLLIGWGVYCYFTFLSPAQAAMTKYNIDVFQLNSLRATIVLPVLFIWSAILYSYLKVYNYSQTIIQNQDGKGFRLIANGIFCMLLSSFIAAYISLVIQYSVDNQLLIKNLRIFNNYLVLFLSILSFYFIWKGSKKFIAIVDAEKKIKKQNAIVLFSILLLSLPYVYFVLQNPIRSMSNSPDISATYNLPDYLIFTTIVIPYIVSWTFGIFSVVNMSIFKERTNGIIYKNALGKFYKGFLTVIILAISLQYLTQFSTFLQQSALSVILFIIYIILITNAAGLFFVARGARELNKLETI